MKLSVGTKTVMAIGDLHYPFAHPDHLAFLCEVRDKVKPTDFICMGDELDAHALSEYDHDPDGYSAGHELKAAVADLKKLYKQFPKMLVCTSNHTARPFRRALKVGLPRVLIREYKEFLEAPVGWAWADGWEVDGVLYEHGEGFLGKNAALSAAVANMQSTVIGHVHSFAGVQYHANPKHLIFGFNVGCLIDVDAYAFGYGSKMKTKPIVGVGIVARGIPTFIPMAMDKYGRWTGKL
jgi:hypothetical protein